MIDPEARLRLQTHVAVDTLRSLRWTLIAALVAPLVLFLGIISFDRNQVLNRVADDASQGASMLREHALKVMETHALLLDQIERRIQGLSWEDMRQQSGVLSTDMRAMAAGLPQVSVLAVTDRDARQWVTTAPMEPQTVIVVAHREYWSAQHEADQGTFISRQYVGMSTGRANFGISRRHQRQNETFDGTVHVAVAVSYFTDFWKQSLIGREGASISLVRTDGEMLARWPVPMGELPRLTQDNSVMMRRYAQEQTDGVYQAASTVDGVQRIYAYERVGSYPLIVVYGVSVAEALVPWRQHVRAIGGICAIAAVTLSVAVLMAMRQANRLCEAHVRWAEAEKVAWDAQRLEVLGQLTAGVAHDFANVLQAVQGGAELIMKQTKEESSRRLARLVIAASAQGAALSRRMLDFARHGSAECDGPPPSADPGKVVADVCALLSSTLSVAHSLRLEMTTDGLPSRVRGDPAMLERSIINLVLNARDAMARSGEIVVSVVPETVSDSAKTVPSARSALLLPGLYARFSVTDNGAGMPPEVLARASEPFFTTKPRGQGTGLGLAGVRGFAEEAGGVLQIESAVGRGTTVTFWLPATEGADG